MKYFFNFCHCSRTVGFGISAIFVKARLPARLLCRYTHILDLCRSTRNSSGSLRPGRRTSNYEGGGIGACSVGTYREDFSVTFLQRRARGSHLPSAIRGETGRSMPVCDLRRARQKFGARCRGHLRGSWFSCTAISRPSPVTF